MLRPSPPRANAGINPPQAGLPAPVQSPARRRHPPRRLPQGHCRRGARFLASHPATHSGALSILQSAVEPLGSQPLWVLLAATATLLGSRLPQRRRPLFLACAAPPAKREISTRLALGALHAAASGPSAPSPIASFSRFAGGLVRSRSPRRRSPASPSFLQNRHSSAGSDTRLPVRVARAPYPRSRRRHASCSSPCPSRSALQRAGELASAASRSSVIIAGRKSLLIVLASGERRVRETSARLPAKNGTTSLASCRFP